MFPLLKLQQNLCNATTVYASIQFITSHLSYIQETEGFVKLYDFLCFFVLGWNLVCHSKGGAWIECVWEQNVRVIFAPKKYEVTGGWRRLHNEELHNLCCSPNIARMIKSNTMGEAGYMYTQCFDLKMLRDRAHTRLLHACCYNSETNLIDI
jgi:hypothetical protein